MNRTEEAVEDFWSFKNVKKEDSIMAVNLLGFQIVELCDRRKIQVLCWSRKNVLAFAYEK